MDIDFDMRSGQLEVLDSMQRFNVLLAHRRWGKTVAAIMILIIKALECKHKNPVVHYYCPSYQQAKRVSWSYLKDFTIDMGAEFNESELKCTLPTGAVIQLGSADNPDSSRGIYSDFCVLDEPSQMSQRMWTEVLRPALSDRLGGALFIGTPMGEHGLFYDTYREAEEDPEWFRAMYKASETNIIPESELAAMKKSMSKAEYNQELECSFSAAIRGAYYGETIHAIATKGNISVFPHDESKQVYATFDLGVNDATAIWYFQVEGEQVTFIDHEEISNTGLPDIIAHMNQKPYKYGKMAFPHDVMVQSLSTGSTRKATLQNLGVEVVVAPKYSLIEGIELTRTLLKSCRFDKSKCKYGLDALRAYKSDWNDKQGVMRLVPLHDWSSHSADSMRTLACLDINQFNPYHWSEPLEYANSGRH